MQETTAIRVSAVSNALLGVSLFALAGAVDTILDGGHAVAAGPALVYAGVAVAACLGPAVIQHRVARRTGSPLITVDARNWFINAAVSSTVGLAFLVTIFMEGTGWAPAIPYVMATALLPGEKTADLDRIRSGIEKKLEPEAPDLVIDILFTGEERRIR